MATDLDAVVKAFRARPRDLGLPDTLVVAAVLVVQSGEAGLVMNVFALPAVRVNAGDHPWVIGKQVTCGGSTAPACWRSTVTWPPVAT